MDAVAHVTRLCLFPPFRDEPGGYTGTGFVLVACSIYLGAGHRAEAARIVGLVISALFVGLTFVSLLSMVLLHGRAIFFSSPVWERAALELLPPMVTVLLLTRAPVIAWARRRTWATSGEDMPAHGT